MLLDVRGGYLYEHCPHLFPEGCLTQVEVILWEIYYVWKDREKANNKTN